MRIKSILILLVVISSMANAKKAMFMYNVSLATTDTIDTEKWIYMKYTVDKENELAQKYTNLISQVLHEYVSASEFSDENILETLEGNLDRQYKDNHWGVIWNAWKYSTLFHSKIVIKTFRDFIFQKACDILCELAAFYPQDYKTHLIRAFTEVQKMLNDIPNHKYEIEDSDPNDDWEHLIFFKDGVANEYLGYGIQGFLLRRIYMDNIPLAEIKEKTATLLNKLKTIDTSNNPSIMARYIINDEIVYCIAAQENYFISLTTNKKFYPYADEYMRAYYANVIRYRYNVGQGFYNISNYRWCNEKGTTIVDKNMNVIYKE